MKERGLILSAPMVRATLDDRKTVTRRVVKGSRAFHERAVLRALLSDTTARTCDAVFSVDDVETGVRCPFGFVDRLWVREAFALSVRDPEAFERDTKNPDDWDGVVYRATDENTGEWEHYDEDGKRTKIPPPWRSPRFMPRWASRILLELVDIRLERLHKITADEVRKEGLELPPSPAVRAICPCETQVEEPGPHIAMCRWRDPDFDPIDDPLVEHFAHGWNALNRKRAPWSLNPWVWRYAFRRVGAATS